MPSFFKCGNANRRLNAAIKTRNNHLKLKTEMPENARAHNPLKAIGEELLTRSPGFEVLKNEPE